MADSAVDPITLELVHEGLIAIIREMRANVIRTAYSSILYEGHDFSCGIVDEKGQLVANAPADHPIHIFPVPWSVRAVLDRFGDDIHPGDVFLHNDPYTGGTHLNDAATIYPVFLEGWLAAFSVVRAHWGDVGGMTPGSLSGQATEIFQEGMRVPAMRIHDGGRPNQAVLDLLFANVRGSRQRLGDFTATLVSCRQGARKLEAMATKYGADTLRGCMATILDRAEERMRSRIAATPDGTYVYEAYVESSGRALEPRLLRLALTVRDGEITADFAGSSGQSEGPMNVGPAMPPTAVFTIVKSYFDPPSPVNHGCWRPLHVKAPEGSFLNARPPAACGGMGEVCYISQSVVMGALSAAMPESATGDTKGSGNHLYIGGQTDRGEQFLFYEYPDGATGGFNGGDGSNAVRNWQSGDFSSILSAEVVENEQPLLIERSGVRRDSAGAGRWRGGFGMQREVRLMTDRGLLSVLSDHNILGAHGVRGGESARGNRFTVRRDGVEIDPSAIPGKVTGFPLRRGDVVIMRSSGGGGYGDPLDRPLEAVLHDVTEGYLSPEAARTHFGLVLRDGGVDEAATRALRAEMRAGRVSATLVAMERDEFQGSRRVLRLCKKMAERAGIGEGDVVELVAQSRAPLRAWAHLEEDGGDRAYLGPVGLAVLGAQGGDRLWLRRLGAWAPPPFA